MNQSVFCVRCGVRKSEGFFERWEGYRCIDCEIAALDKRIERNDFWGYVMWWSGWITGGLAAVINAIF
jgi:hypothetical protein